MFAWIQGGLFLGGFALLLVAGLLRPGERTRANHWLEALWVRVDDLQKAGLRRQAATLKAVNERTSSLIDALFGARLISLKAALASVGLSLVSILVFLLFVSALPFARAEFNRWLASGAVIALWLAVVAPNRWIALLGWGAGVLGVFWCIRPVHNAHDLHRGGILVVAFVCSGLCDVIFVAIMRLLLKLSAGATSLMALVGMSIMNVAVGLLFYVGPMVVGVQQSGPGLDGQLTDVGSVASLVGVSNLLEVLLALLGGAIWAAAVLHRILWPLAERTVFALADAKIFERRKWIVAIGASMISIGSPRVGAWIVKVLRLLVL